MCKDNCGECCGNVPIYSSIYARNYDKLQRKIVSIVRLSSREVFPITEDGKCPFLNSQMRCEIYPYRHWICRLYGNEVLPCPYFKPDGSPRAPEEMKEIQDHINTYVDEGVKKFAKAIKEESK